MEIDQLKSTLQSAISQFNNNRASILATANDQLGQDGVTQLEDKYDQLCDQYQQLLQAALDVNATAYASLSDIAHKEGTDLQASVNSLDDINKTIDLVSSIVGTVSSLLAVV